MIHELLYTRPFRGFTGDTPEPEARAAFRARYGRDPEYIVLSLGILLVGPIPQEAADGR